MDAVLDSAGLYLQMSSTADGLGQAWVAVMRLGLVTSFLPSDGKIT